MSTERAVIGTAFSGAVLSILAENIWTGTHDKIIKTTQNTKIVNSADLLRLTDFQKLNLRINKTEYITFRKPSICKLYVINGFNLK